MTWRVLSKLGAVPLPGAVWTVEGVPVKVLVPV